MGDTFAESYHTHPAFVGAGLARVMTERRLTPREAYERGASVEALKKWFHLSDSEAQDIAPEEFEDKPERGDVSGY